MRVFHFFKIVQMVPNRATHHIFYVYLQAQLMEPNHNKGGLAGLIPSKQFQLQ